MKDAWHLFKIRCAVLTSPWLSLAPVMGAEMRLTEITLATASLLFVNALTLLDDATELRLSQQELKRAPKLAQRLILLAERGDLQNYAALDSLRKRRNEIGHEMGKDATVEELNSACRLIQEQLVVWGLVENSPPYKLYFERSAMRECSEPGYAFEHDRIVRVLKDDKPVCEWKQMMRLANAE